MDAKRVSVGTRHEGGRSIKMDKTALGFKTQLHTDLMTAQTKVTDALKSQGFGVLTEIDVKNTLKQKLNVDFRPYKILGACNPTLAHQALELEPEVGLLLPCNVTLSEIEPGLTEVAIIDPLVMLGVVQNPQMQPIADQARQRLEKVMDALQEE